MYVLYAMHAICVLCPRCCLHAMEVSTSSSENQHPGLESVQITKIQNHEILVFEPERTKSEMSLWWWNVTILEPVQKCASNVVIFDVL